MLMSAEATKAAVDAQKARTATRYAINTLLWLVVAAGIGVLPAVVAAGWRWFL